MCTVVSTFPNDVYLCMSNVFKRRFHRRVILYSNVAYSITEEDVKIRFGEILKVNVFSRPLLERNYMRGSISIENILFSRNCDIKITNAKSATDASIWVMCVSINSYTLGIAEASLFNSPIIICRCGFHVRSTDLADKPQSLDSGSICKQTWIKTL